MAYELFHNKAAKTGAPQFTIRGGRIALNAQAGDILVKSGVRFVHILWDSELRKLALKPITKVDEKAFRFSIPAGKRGGTFSAQSFLNYVGWNAAEPIVVSAEWNERERLLEARLPKENIGWADKGRVVKRRGKGIS